jgi:hypothetical protein
VVTNFLTGEKNKTLFTDPETGAVHGHLGGNEGIMADFIDALRSKDRNLSISSPAISLESHLMAFAYERSRLNHSVEEIAV